jgi:hypothetical protein
MTIFGNLMRLSPYSSHVRLFIITQGKMEAIAFYVQKNRSVFISLRGLITRVYLEAFLT